LAPAALALVIFGAYDSYLKLQNTLFDVNRFFFFVVLLRSVQISVFNKLPGHFFRLEKNRSLERQLVPS